MHGAQAQAPGGSIGDGEYRKPDVAAASKIENKKKRMSNDDESRGDHAAPSVGNGVDNGESPVENGESPADNGEPVDLLGTLKRRKGDKRDKKGKGGKRRKVDAGKTQRCDTVDMQQVVGLVCPWRRRGWCGGSRR